MERLNGKDQAFFSCIEFGVNTKKWMKVARSGGTASIYSQLC